MACVCCEERQSCPSVSVSGTWIARLNMEVLNDASCGGLWDEGVIRSASAGLSICGNGFSPIPDGFIVTSASTVDKTTCGGVPIYQLGVAGPGAVMCSFSPNPTGYVVGQVNSSSQCNGQNARVLKPVTQGVVGCSFSTQLDGYVVTAGAQANNCVDGALRGDYWTYTQVCDGVNVCPYSQQPSGYYLTGTVTKSNYYGASFGYVLKKLQ